MAIDVRARDAGHAEDRGLGGGLLVWVVLLIISLPFLFIGLQLAPQTGGWLLVAASGILAGLSYTETMLRLPSITHRFGLSLLVLLVVSAVVLGGLLLFAQSLPSPSPNPDVLLQPPAG